MSKQLPSTEQPIISPKVGSVYEACEAIYQQCLANNEPFNAYDCFRIEDIKAKRTELGFEAGSNTTIIKGKKLWLAQNQHRLNNPENTTVSTTAATPDDPMMGLIHKIRIDLQHEAEQKITVAETAWADEKQALLTELEQCSTEYEKLAADKVQSEDLLADTQDKVQQLAEKLDINEYELATNQAELKCQVQNNVVLKEKLDEWLESQQQDFANHKSDLSAFIQSERKSNQQLQTKWCQALEDIKVQQAEALDKAYAIVRDKEDEIIELAVQKSNLELVNKRLTKENSEFIISAKEAQQALSKQIEQAQALQEKLTLLQKQRQTDQQALNRALKGEARLVEQIAKLKRNSTKASTRCTS